MEPLDDKELNSLLRKWEAPAAPASLERRVLPARQPWWKWLFSGTIRIPVPVGIAAAVVIGLWIHYSRPTTVIEVKQPTPSVNLADFEPVQQLEPVLIGERK